MPISEAREVEDLQLVIAEQRLQVRARADLAARSAHRRRSRRRAELHHAEPSRTAEPLVSVSIATAPV